MRRALRRKNIVEGVDGGGGGRGWGIEGFSGKHVNSTRRFEIKDKLETILLN